MIPRFIYTCRRDIPLGFEIAGSQISEKCIPRKYILVADAPLGLGSRQCRAAGKDMMQRWKKRKMKKCKTLSRTGANINGKHSSLGVTE